MLPLSKSSPEDDSVVITDRDIVFDCQFCGGELVVDRDGEGMDLQCVHCGAAVKVPLYSETKAGGGGGAVGKKGADTVQVANPEAAPRPALSFDHSGLSKEDAESRFNDLSRQLKENESQRVETRGHVNRTLLTLHRYQMQLERLVARQHEIEEEIKALKSKLS